MTSTGNNGPQDAPQSRSQAKASRREQMRQEMLRQQAAARRTSQLKTAGAVALVVAVIAAIVIVVVLNTGGKKNAAAPSGPAGSAVIGAITGVPASTIDAVGAGTSNNPPAAVKSPTPLTADGKPRVLYVGGEFCPFCAAERWSVVNALSRFGTFSNLGQTSSSSTDVFPDTATLSFHGATYTSDYLSFTGVELTDRDQQPLDTLSADDKKTVSTLNPKGSIPFVVYGGKFTTAGAGYDPQVLQGKSHQQIADALKDPTSDITKAIVGQANQITAALCQLTDQKPADVCGAAGVKAAG